MRGVVFAESSDFEPRDAPAWLSANVGGAPPPTTQEVLSVAQRQLLFVRSLYPGATGKMLTVLHVGRTGIARRSVPLLIGGFFHRQRTGRGGSGFGVAAAS